MTNPQKRARLREILADSRGTVAPGVTDPIFARLAAECGYSAVHLSGNAIHKSFCLPDRNLLTVTEIASRALQIADVTDLPLIVDGGPAARQTLGIARAVRSLEGAGSAAVRFEDGYLDDLDSEAAVAVLPKTLMVDRIKAAVDARIDPTLVLIARCDARCCESLGHVEERLAAYAEAGADAVGVSAFRPSRVSSRWPALAGPLVSLWPKAHVTVLEFLQLGFKIALMPSSISLAALSAVKEMLLVLKNQGTERDYFSRQKNIQEVERWYRDLDMFRK
jgi:2-methylisocitrate lyase-like PEP mutase family enzyme